MKSQSFPANHRPQSINISYNEIWSFVFVEQQLSLIDLRHVRYRRHRRLIDCALDLHLNLCLLRKTFGRKCNNGKKKDCQVLFVGICVRGMIILSRDFRSCLEFTLEATRLNSRAVSLCSSALDLFI